PAQDRAQHDRDHGQPPIPHSDPSDRQPRPHGTSLCTEVDTRQHPTRLARSPVAEAHTLEGMDDRYGGDVLATGWRDRGTVKASDVPAEKDLVVEVAEDGYCGAITRVEAGLVELEDWKGRRRSFPLGGGFLIEGKPVRLTAPSVKAQGTRRTASGSFTVADDRAKVARPSRILGEGRHDAELVEKVWGADLRVEGVVVEYLQGIDLLDEVLTEAPPNANRRYGVLVDHLVPGSKETRMVEQIQRGPHGAHLKIVGDRKSTRLNSSHVKISYAVFCL